MKLASLFRKQDGSDHAMDMLGDELENELDLMVSMDLGVPPVDMIHEDGSVSGEPVAIPDGGVDEAASVETGPRLTSYAQSRLATLTTFQEMQLDVADDLKAVTAALARLGAATSQTREFISSTHASIHRANELELGNAALLSENRKLHQQVEQVKRLRSQHETLTEAFRRKEMRHEEEAHELKAEITSVRGELQESRDSLSSVEAERAVLLGELSTKSAMADRNARENELLREKQIGLTHELEHAERRAGEMERKVDELTAINSAQTGQIADLRSRLSTSEKEAFQLQKQYDTASARLGEAQDALTAAETEMDNGKKHHAAETQRLKGEIETLKARADVSTKAQLQASDEIGALKQKLAMLEADKAQVEERLRIARTELEDERAQHSTITAQASESDLQNESVAIMLEARNQEVEELRREMKSQKEEMRRLASVERLYKLLKEKRQDAQREAAE